jgi:integrase
VIYKASRDIPKACRLLKTRSPTKIAEWIRENRTEKDRATKKRRQSTVKVNAVIKWMSRNPKVMEEIEAEIKDEELSKTAISETLFDNGTFREIPSIKTWLLELTGREAKSESINAMLGDIKRICKGEVRRAGVTGKPRQSDYEIIEGWGLKHPDKLGLEDVLAYIQELKKRGHKTRQYRLSGRNFLQSKGVKGFHKISGKISQMGKYAHLFASKEKIYAIFDYIKGLNYEAYLASKFAYKCGGCRTNATLTANASKFAFDGTDHTIFVEEKATRGKEKRIQEKLIPSDFWEEIKDRKGTLFHIEKQELRNLLKTAYKEIIPELVEEIVMPFHFWRHQFAQHLLRATDWNYGLVARLGHWTVETLERYYGKMDRKTAYTSARKHLPNL